MIPNLLELVIRIEVPIPYTKYYEPYWANFCQRALGQYYMPRGSSI
jgi:hypothetical protein